LRGDIGLGKNWRAQAWIELCVGEFAIPRTRAARCSPLSEGWSCVVEWWKEGDDDEKGIGGVDEIVVVDGDRRWDKNGRWLHSEKMQHRQGLICKQ